MSLSLFKYSNSSKLKYIVVSSAYNKKFSLLLTLIRSLMYSGGKKNPDLPIKSIENLYMTCRHCKRLVTTPTDVVLCLYSQLYEIALRILYTSIRCCS